MFYLDLGISSYVFSLLLILFLLSLWLAMFALGIFDLSLPVSLHIQLLHYGAFHPPRLAFKTVLLPRLWAAY